MADETPAPLSDAEIRWLRIGLEDIKRHGVSLGSPTLEMTRRLYATILAQDARLAALERVLAFQREIVAAVAATEREDDIPGDPNATRIAVALVDRARALLATQTPGTTVEGDPAVCASCGKPAVIHDSGDPYCAQCYHDATGEWPGTTGATGATAGEEGEA